MDKKTTERKAEELALAPWGARTVNMSNALVSSAQALSVREKRLMTLAVSKIDSVRHAGSSPPKIRVEAKEYSEFTGVALNDAYKDLMDASENLRKRTITFSHEWKKTPTSKRTYKAITRTGWVDSATYIEGCGVVELLFTVAVTPHLTMLRNKFTSYQLHQASTLRSLYSWRLLELFMQFESTGWREFTVEDFCNTLELGEAYRKNVAQIKRRVIVPAIKELEAKDHWLISVSYKKHGRKVHSIRFHFKRNPQGDLFNV